MPEKKVIPVALVSILTFITLSTSVMAFNKIWSSVGQISGKRTISAENESIDQKSDNAEDKKQNDKKEEIKNNKVTPGIALKSSTPKKAGTTLNTVSKPGNNLTTQSISPTQAVNNVNSGSAGCIVTIFGKQYDATSLRNTHSGGNIFNCGTDMSSSYQSKHGTNVSLIAPYLITSPGGGTGVSPSPAAVTGGPQNPTGAPPGRGEDDEDEGDD